MAFYKAFALLRFAVIQSTLLILFAEICPNRTSIGDFLGCNSSEVVLLHGSYFAINNCEKVVHTIPDRFTAYQFHNHQHVGNKYEFPSNYSRGVRIQSNIKPNTKFERLGSRKPNHKIMMQSKGPLRLLKGLLNPSYEYFQGDLIIAWRLRPMNDFQSSTVTRIVRIPKRLKVASKLGFEINSKYWKDFQVLSTFDKPKKVLPMMPYVDITNAEDMRLFVKNGHLMGHFARRYDVHGGENPEIQTSFCFFQILLNNSLVITKTILANVNDWFPKQDQKNWCHFHYNDSVSFISRMTPYTVVFFSPIAKYLNFDANNVNDFIDVPLGVIISSSQVSLNYLFGQLRGGTSGVLISEGYFKSISTKSILRRNMQFPFYLSFFHSSNEPNAKNCPKTYSMGAFIFQAKPPFLPLAMSEIPLVHSEMYTGPWVENYIDTVYIADYIVFPMSIFVSEVDDEVYILYGYQDLHGYLITLKLSTVLESLVRVHV